MVCTSLLLKFESAHPQREDWGCLTEGQRRVLSNTTIEDIDIAGFADYLGSLDSTNIFNFDRALTRIVPPALLPKSGLVRELSDIPDGALSRVQGGDSAAFKYVAIYFGFPHFCVLVSYFSK